MFSKGEDFTEFLIKASITKHSCKVVFLLKKCSSSKIGFSCKMLSKMSSNLHTFGWYESSSLL